MEFNDLAAQYRHMKKRINQRIQNVLDHGQYIMGPEVHELEEKLASYVGVKHCISCANGTDALTLALMALDIKAGDAVFCPTFTFFATAESVALRGARPVFVDSDAATFNLSAGHLEIQIERTLAEGRFCPKAIVAVDLFGLPANYPAIERLAKKYNLKLIEDAAQGFGGAINGKRVGSFGDIATTSFFPAKPLGCYGDGGALFTDNDHYAELLRSFRVHGKGADKYDNVRIGINSRLDTIQAAVLLEKLIEFPFELEARNLAAARYSKKYCEVFTTPEVPDGYTSSWAQYTLVTHDRAAAEAEFKGLGVPTAVYYRTCMHQQPVFTSLGYLDAELPVASRLAGQVLSLPMHPYL